MKFHDFKIPNGEQVSQWVKASDLFGSDAEADQYVIGRVICPAVLSSITSLTIETEYGGATKSVKDQDGVAVTIAVGANVDVALKPSAFAMVPGKFRIKSNVVASADRYFSLGFRKA